MEEGNNSTLKEKMRLGRKTLEQIKEEEELIQSSDLDLKFETPQFWKRKELKDV